MKLLAAIKKLANEAALARSYSAVVIGYPVTKITGERSVGCFPSKQCFVIIPNVTYFDILCPGMTLC